MLKKIIAIIAAIALIAAVTGVPGIAADSFGYSVTPQVHACNPHGSGGGC